MGPRISVNGTAFTDVWEAIAANNPFNVEFIGDDANQAKLDTTTKFPVMMSDQMMRVATIRKQLRAGTTKSRVTRQDRLVERDDINDRAGALWQSFDFQANVANQSIFQDPGD